MGYNKITLHPNQTCNYFQLLKSTSDIDLLSTAVAYEPTLWNEKTLFNALFNANLVAGDSTITSAITGYKIYRKDVNQAEPKYVATISSEDKFVVDYLVANRHEYIYMLSPSGDVATYQPLISQPVKTLWDSWSLMVVDETTEKNVYTLSKMFNYKLNLSTGDMTNNAEVNVIKNFTAFPKIQHSPSNFMSGQLKALMGFVARDGTYAQTPDMVKELASLSTDTRRKFLKDIEGNIWEVDITASIDFTNNDATAEQAKEVSLKWTEIAKVENISIINTEKPDQWLLTNTGTPLSYVNYVWSEGEIWDSTKYWTGNNNVLE